MAGFAFASSDRDEWAESVSAAVAAAAWAVRKKMARRLDRRSLPKNAAAVFKPVWWTSALDERAAPVFERVAGQAANGFAAGAGVPLSVDDRESIVEGLVAGALALLAGRGDVVGDRVKDLLATGKAEGWDAARLAEELGVSGDGGSGPLSDALLSGYGSGLATGLTEGAAHGIFASFEGTKTWRTEQDENVRWEHSELEGVTVRKGDAFDMGGWDAMYPADEGLPAELAANCRCWLEYDVEDVSADESEEFAVSGGGVVAAPPSTTESGSAPTLPGVEMTSWISRAAAAYADTDGIIVTVEPAPLEKAALAIVGGTPTPQLHVTLVYLPVDPADSDARHVISQVLASIAEQTVPITGTVSGLGWFEAPTAMTLGLVDAPGLAALRTLIHNALVDAGYPPDDTHDFEPHVTLADTGVDAADKVGLPLSFNELRLRWQTDTLVFDLFGEAAPEAPADVPVPAPEEEGPVPADQTTEAPAAPTPVPAAPAPAAAGGRVALAEAPVVPPPDAPVDAPADAPADEAAAPAPDPQFGDIDTAALIDEVARRAIADAGGDAEDYNAALEELTETVSDLTADTADEEVAEGEVTPEDMAPVVAAAGDTDIEPTVDAPAAPETKPYDWEGYLTVEGLPSGDRRMIAPMALSWRDLPLPITLMTVNAGGHDGAVVCGNIAEIERVELEAGTFAIIGRGYLSATDTGQLARTLLAEGTMRGISVDLDMVTSVLADSSGAPLDADADPYGVDMYDLCIEGRIMSACVCATPAFQEAAIHLLDSEALVASGGSGTGWRLEANQPFVVGGSLEAAIVASAGANDVGAPPMSLFMPRPMETPEPFQVLAPLADGTIPVYGLVAQWGTCHIGNARQCIGVPRSSNFRSFYTGKRVLTREGELLPVGPIIMDTVHPNLRASASDAQAFYAETGCAVADVQLHTNEHGIVAAGVMRPTVPATTVRRLRASDISPDWRPINGEHRLVSLLAVNTSGFLVEGIAASAMQFRTWALVEPDGGIGAMVATGALHKERTTSASLASMVDALAARVEELEAKLVGKFFVPPESAATARADSLFSELGLAVSPVAERAARSASLFSALGIDDGVACSECEAAA